VHWVLHLAGVDDLSGRWYGFWSGVGSDLAYLGIFGTLARKHNCHEPRCWRIGRFPVEGTAWSACRRHSPVPPGRGSIREQYHLYAGKRPGRG
jgi:hypothetical protein